MVERPKSDRDWAILCVGAKKDKDIFPTNDLAKNPIYNAGKYLASMKCVEIREMERVKRTYFGPSNIRNWEKIFDPRTSKRGYKRCEGLACPLVSGRKLCPLYLEAGGVKKKVQSSNRK
jgi:hypothetical protein